MANQIALVSGGSSYYAPDGQSGATMIAGLKAWRRMMLSTYLGAIATAILAGFLQRGSADAVRQ